MEVMVWKWPETRDPGRLLAFAGTYGVPVLAIHSPTLLLTQRVWGTDAWGKIDRSVELAEAVGAEVVVVHPRSAGSASTPPASSRASRGARPRPRCGSRWRTCSRGRPAP